MKPVSLWTVWKLRLQLWWKFGVDEWKNGKASQHRLKIRWSARFNSWNWYCVVGRAGEPVWKYNLGPLRQWSLQEALGLAARKAEWVLHPDQEPVKEAQPNPPQPKHHQVYRMMEGGTFRVECVCGWTGGTRCHGETTAPNWCALCALAEKSYVEHEASSRENSGDFRQQGVSGMTMTENFAKGQR